MKTLLIVFLRFFLVFISPFSLGGLFLVLLIARSLAVGIINGFIGLILFIVYVGGTMVLFTYCFILAPRQKWGPFAHLYPLALGGLGLGAFSWGSYSPIYEFYWIPSLLGIVVVLLFIVILRVVEMVDLTMGSMRVECGLNLKFLFP